MDFIKQNKLAAGGALVVIIAVIMYFFYFSGGDKSSSATLTSSDQSPVSTDLLVALQNLNGIKLDDSIFKNPVFVSLTDFGVIIPLQDVGRRNPFLPLSGSFSPPKAAPK